MIPDLSLFFESIFSYFILFFIFYLGILYIVFYCIALSFSIFYYFCNFYAIITFYSIHSTLDDAKLFIDMSILDYSKRYPNYNHVTTFYRILKLKTNTNYFCDNFIKLTTFDEPRAI